MMVINKREELKKEIKDTNYEISKLKEKVRQLRKDLWLNNERICSCGFQLRKYITKSSNHEYWICDCCLHTYNPNGNLNKEKTPWRGSQDDFTDDYDNEEEYNDEM